MYTDIFRKKEMIQLEIMLSVFVENKTSIKFTIKIANFQFGWLLNVCSIATGGRFSYFFKQNTPFSFSASWFGLKYPNLNLNVSCSYECKFYKWCWDTFSFPLYLERYYQHIEKLAVKFVKFIRFSGRYYRKKRLFL